MIKLKGYNLDREGREMYAEEVDINGVVNREFYYTKGKSFLARTIQLRSIDKLLKNVGFRNSSNVTLMDFIDFINSRMEGIKVDYPHYTLYYNGQNTRVQISPDSYLPVGLHGYVRAYTGLIVEVGKKGSFEDYVWTCNLFRKFFGLKERIAQEEGNRKWNAQIPILNKNRQQGNKIPEN